MSTLSTGDMKLVLPELTDTKEVTIGTDLPANFTKIDNTVTELSAKEWQDVQNVYAKYDTEVIQINERINNIISTPVEGVSAAEIVDARGTYPLLGNRLVANDASDAIMASDILDNTEAIHNVVSPYIYEKALFTIVDDDAKSEFITRMKPVYDARGVKVTLGVVTDFVDGTGNMTKAELLQLQSEGYEIASHSKTHSQTIFQDNLINEPDASYDVEFGGSKQWLLDNGFGVVDTIVYPFANFDSHSGVPGSAKRIKNLAKKFYNNGVNADGWMNDGVIDNMYAKRFFLDMTQFDLAAVKGIIDIAIANKSWLVLGIHSWSETQNDATYVGGIIDYIKGLNAEILPFRDAVKLRGNKVSIGEFTDTDDGFFVGYDGTILDKNAVDMAQINSTLASHTSTLAGHTSSIATNTSNIVQLSNPNLLINGDFQIWQRGSTISNPIGGQKYTCDRWMVAGGGAILSFSKLSTGELRITNPTNFTANTRVQQAIEFPKSVQGQKITISCKIKSSTTKKIGISILSGLTSTYVAGKEVTLTSEYQTISLSATAPIGNDILVFALGLSTASGSVGTPYLGLTSTTDYPACSIDIAWAKMEVGDKATPFISRLYGEEVALCQRYFEKSYDSNVAPYTSLSVFGLEDKLVPSNTITNNQSYGATSFKVTKRNTPTITIYPYTTPTNINRVSTASGTDLAANSGQTNQVGTNGFTTVNVGGTLTGEGYSVLYHWTADAEIY